MLRIERFQFRECASPRRDWRYGRLYFCFLFVFSRAAGTGDVRPRIGDDSHSIVTRFYRLVNIYLVVFIRMKRRGEKSGRWAIRMTKQSIRTLYGARNILTQEGRGGAALQGDRVWLGLAVDGLAARNLQSAHEHTISHRVRRNF